jgi:hypothetical protein
MLVLEWDVRVEGINRWMILAGDDRISPSSFSMKGMRSRYLNGLESSYSLHSPFTWREATRVVPRKQPNQ